MADSPSEVKKLRLTPRGIDILPDEILEKIFNRLPMKIRVKSVIRVNKRWHRVTPYLDANSTLKVAKLPFAHRFTESVTGDIKPDGITVALNCLLPQLVTKLKVLSFDGGRLLKCHLIEDHLDVVVRLCPNLGGLDLRDIRLSDSPVDLSRLIAKLRQLTRVNSFTFDRGFSLAAFNSVQLYQDLSSLLAIWPLEKLQIECVTPLPSLVCLRLKHLRLRRCAMSETQFVQMCQTSPTLTHLTLNDCKVVNLSPIANLVNLDCLELLDQNFSESELNIICVNCTHLTSLQFDRYDGHLHSLRFLNQLERLKLGSGQLTDSSVMEVSAVLPHLREFSVSSPNVTDVSFHSLLSGCPLLEVLNLKDAKIVDTTVALLAESQLKVLRLEWCPLLTTEGISLLNDRRMRSKLTLMVGLFHPLWN